MMLAEHAEFQNQLPSGMTIEEELAGPNYFGRVFKVNDSRLGTDRPFTRVVRFMKIPQQCRQTFLDRAAVLMAAPLPYAATPREILFANDGTILVIEDWLGRRLDEHIEEYKGLPVDEVRSIADHLLEALDSVHGTGLAHGGLQTRSIFSAYGKTNTPRISLAEAVLGAMPFDSHGEWRDEDAARYRPPEWNGEIREPSVAGDMYALGATICELMYGRKANPNRCENHGDQQGYNQQLKATLSRARKDGRSIYKLLRRLMGSENHRPTSARAALMQLRRTWPKARLRAVILGTAAVVCVVGFLSWFAITREAKVVSSQDQLAKLQKTVADGETDLTKERSRNEKLSGDLNAERKSTDALRIQNDKLNSDNKVLRDQLKIQDQQLIDAQKHWKGRVTDLETPVELSSLGDGPRTLAKPWEIDRANFSRRAKGWLTANADNELRQRIDSWLKQPWEEKLRSAVDDRLNGLELAAMQWNRWAGDEEVVTLNDYFERVKRLKHNEAEKVLNHWLDELKGPRKCFFDPTTASLSAPAGYGRALSLYVNGDKSQPWIHSWSDEQKHTYTSDDKFPFPWSVSEKSDALSIGILLEGPGYHLWDGIPLVGGTQIGWRASLIDRREAYKGPFAIWKFARDRKVSGGENTLDFEIENCPGPPTTMKVFSNP